MSARIAHVFWTDPARPFLPAEFATVAQDWAEAAEGYRALVRASLRMAEHEGIRLRQDPAAPVETGSERWMTMTARLAWLMWLKSNRTTGRVARPDELQVWGTEAADYRAFVRSVARRLEKNGTYLFA